MNGINEITPNPHIVIANTAQNAPTHAVKRDTSQLFDENNSKFQMMLAILSTLIHKTVRIWRINEP